MGTVAISQDAPRVVAGLLEEKNRSRNCVDLEFTIRELSETTARKRPSLLSG